MDSTEQAVAALPRIKSRAASAVFPNTPTAQFYDTSTGYTFRPVGTNYIKLSWYNGEPYHSTFQPSLWNPASVESALTEMQANGYNVVRVFISPKNPPGASTGGVGGPEATDVAKLDASYMANVKDFLVRARAHRLHVIVVLDFFPNTVYYNTIGNQNCPANIKGGFSAHYLCLGFIDAKKEYVAEFVHELKTPDPTLLSTIFAYELQNEIFMKTDEPPFNMTTGSVTTGDMGTYNMADPARRQQCQDANVVAFLVAAKNAIRSEDMDAMVTASVFTFAGVGRTGPSGLWPIPSGTEQRWPARPATMLLYGQLSYLDFHSYPKANGYSLVTDLNSSEFASMSKTTIPFFMGEYGAFTTAQNSSTGYATVSAAATALKSDRDAAYGLGFQGAATWMWSANGQNIWAETDSGGVIKNALSPNLRWTFQTAGNFEGWSGFSGWTGQAVSGGALFGLTTGPDPQMLSAAVSINADVSKFVRIQLANNSSSTVSQIYWRRSGDTTWSEARHADVTIAPNNGLYLPYTFDLRSNPNWNGTIVQLRADPVQGGNNGWVGYGEIMVTSQADTPFAN